MTIYNTAHSSSDASPLRQLVDRLIYQAIDDHASDLHFEPFENTLRVRCRIDGTLQKITSTPIQLAQPVASRIKVLAGLDIANTRTPQDGRIRFTHHANRVDLRISTLPTKYGESIVLRVLDQKRLISSVQELGMPLDMALQFSKDLRKTSGLLIATGPTGSGKTTTLYAALQQIMNLGRKILTVEDPVEYDLPGLIQLPTDASSKLTFPSAIRSILRHDPDVIMVGEIRDPETAKAAIEAALTGHLVLTTLHTQDAIGAITRLIDLGVEPYLVAATLSAVIAQRLVRRICPDCKQETVISKTEHHDFFNDFGPLPTLVEGKGCITCRQTGYIGRLGIFEYLHPSSSMREAIRNQASDDILREIANDNYFQNLTCGAYQHLRNQTTTYSELIKAL